MVVADRLDSWAAQGGNFIAVHGAYLVRTQRIEGGD
jgi:hypothetical protein